ncbi:MAG: O-antigen ligase family protein [Pseudomonadota bacterium]|nr:O-antigen ligase family protein [Pseudomonadota bacterium]
MNQPRWVVDEQYRYALVLILVLSYAWAVMPTGLQWRLTLANDTGAVIEDGVGPWFKLQWMPLFGLSAWIILRRYGLILKMAGELNLYLYALAAWAMLSALWAPSFGHVVKQAIIIIGVVLMASAQAVAAWQPGRLEQVLRWTLLGLCVASAAVAIAMPSVGVHQNAAFELNGSWRGIAMTKYLLGHICQFSVLLWTHAAITHRERWRMAGVAIAVSLIVLLNTRSNTSLIVLLLGLAVMVLYTRPPLRLEALGAPLKLALVMLVTAPLLVYLLMVGTLSYADAMAPISGAFGKDVTLSGRTYIWSELWMSISASPRNFLLGVGYMSFWNGPGSLADGAYRRLKWLSPDGHNGYLDIWNELGIIGLVLLLAFLVRHLRSLFRLARFDSAMHGLHFAIFLMVSIENMMASGWFRPVAPSFLLITYSSLAVSRRLYEQRLRKLRAGAVRAQDPYRAAAMSASGT